MALFKESTHGHCRLDHRKAMKVKCTEVGLKPDVEPLKGGNWKL